MGAESISSWKQSGERALVVADYARNEAHDGVGNDGSRQLASREDIVADTDLRA